MKRGLGLLIATTAMAAPPAGVTGWASPLTAAGMIALGAGWAGLVLVFILISALALPQSRYAALAGATLLALWGALFTAPYP